MHNDEAQQLLDVARPVAKRLQQDSEHLRRLLTQLALQRAAEAPAPQPLIAPPVNAKSEPAGADPARVAATLDPINERGFVSAAEAQAGIALTGQGEGGETLTVSRKLAAGNELMATVKLSGEPGSAQRFSTSVRGEILHRELGPGNRTGTVILTGSNRTVARTYEYHDYVPTLEVTCGTFDTETDEDLVVTLATDAYGFEEPGHTELSIALERTGEAAQVLHVDTERFESDAPSAQFALPMSLVRTVAGEPEGVRLLATVENRRYRNRRVINVPIRTAKPREKIPATNKAATPATGKLAGVTTSDLQKISSPSWSRAKRGEQITRAGAGLKTVRTLAKVRARYPKRPSFSSDSRRLYDNDGGIYDLDNKAAEVGRVPSNTFMPDWHDPYLVHYLQGTRLYRWDIRHKPDLVVDFARHGATGSLTFGDFEGKPSLNGIVVVTTKPMRDIWVYSLERGLLGQGRADAIKEAAEKKVGKIKTTLNWISVSLLGQYVTGIFSGEVIFRTELDLTGLDVAGSFDSSGRLWPLHPQHSDNLRDASGADAHAGVHWLGGWAFQWSKLHTIYRIRPQDMPGHGHVSGNAHDRPGLIVHSQRGGGTISGVVFDPADYLGATPRMKEKDKGRLGFPLYPTRNPKKAYYGSGQFKKLGYVDSAMAQPNRDGSAVSFHTGGGPVGFCLAVMR